MDPRLDIQENIYYNNLLSNTDVHHASWTPEQAEPIKLEESEKTNSSIYALAKNSLANLASSRTLKLIAAATALVAAGVFACYATNAYLDNLYKEITEASIYCKDTASPVTCEVVREQCLHTVHQDVCREKHDTYTKICFNDPNFFKISDDGVQIKEPSKECLTAQKAFQAFLVKELQLQGDLLEFNCKLNEVPDNLCSEAIKNFKDKCKENVDSEECEQAEETIENLFKQYKPKFKKPIEVDKCKEAIKTLTGSDNATLRQVKKMYRKLAMKTHPDKEGNAKEFIKITQAYETARECFESNNP